MRQAVEWRKEGRRAGRAVKTIAPFVVSGMHLWEWSVCGRLGPLTVPLQGVVGWPRPANFGHAARVATPARAPPKFRTSLLGLGERALKVHPFTVVLAIIVLDLAATAIALLVDVRWPEMGQAKHWLIGSGAVTVGTTFSMRRQRRQPLPARFPSIFAGGARDIN